MLGSSMTMSMKAEDYATPTYKPTVTATKTKTLRPVTTVQRLAPQQTVIAPPLTTVVPAEEPKTIIPPATLEPGKRPPPPDCATGRVPVWNIQLNAWQCAPDWTPVTGTGAPIEKTIEEAVVGGATDVGVEGDILPSNGVAPGLPIDVVDAPTGFYGIPIWAWVLGGVVILGGAYYFLRK